MNLERHAEICREEAIRRMLPVHRTLATLQNDLQIDGAESKAIHRSFDLVDCAGVCRLIAVISLHCSRLDSVNSFCRYTLPLGGRYGCRIKTSANEILTSIPNRPLIHQTHGQKSGEERIHSSQHWV